MTELRRRAMRLSVSVFSCLGLVGAAVTAGSTAAAAATTAKDVYVACGYGVSVGGPSSCPTLAQAISSAEAGGAASGVAYIELFPGTFCPASIPNDSRSLVIQGVGLAAEPSGTVLSGPEAALTTFNYNDGECPALTGNGELDIKGYSSTASVTIQNVAFEPGSNPGEGVYVTGANLILRDDLFEGASGDGLYYEGSTDTTLTLTSDAFLDNAVGAFLSAQGSVTTSLFAGNTTAGLETDGSIVGLTNDTISDNAIGVDIAGRSDEISAANTIVGDNTSHDCYAEFGLYGQWEYSGGGARGNTGYNLIGSSCDVSTTTDIALTDTLASTAPNGGPTPSIMPPEQALGAGESGWCLSADQREYQATTTSGCDIGSVLSGGVGTQQPAASPTSVTLGSVPVGTTTTQTVTITNAGGDLLGVAKVSASGTGWSVSSDGCTDRVLARAGLQSCAVVVAVKPASAGALTGDLSLHTTGGSLTVPLSATAAGGGDASSLSAPRAATITDGKSVTLATTLLDSTTSHPISGATVALLASVGSAPFASVGSGKTTTEGKVTVTVKPTKNTRYEWGFAGSSGHSAVTSLIARVQVAQLVQLSATKTSVGSGKPTTLYGTVSPAVAGTTIDLEDEVSGAWHETGTKATVKHQLLPDGKTTLGYVLSYQHSGAGTEKLRVLSPATSSNAAGRSAAVVITVT